MRTILGKRRNGMKKDKIIYWTTTGIIAVLMFASAINFAFNKEMHAAFQHLGLPNWFKVELTTAKFFGVLALLAPFAPRITKEFAYFGFGLTIVSADIAHLSSGDPVWFMAPHATFFLILAVSYAYYHKLQNRGSGGGAFILPGSPAAGPGDGPGRNLPAG
jgi:hypothetical protein